MSTSTASTARATSSSVGFHMGQILARVASTYPGIFENGMMMEILQNAIDSGAENIWLTINMIKRSIVVQDDGHGASITEFDVALDSVGHSIKKTSKMGRFGIGLVSPMGKCEKFIFTSTSKRDPRGYNSWTFVCSDILEMKSEINIPISARTELQFNRSGDKGVRWRTEMRIEKFDKNIRAQRLTRDTLTSAIHERFNKAMERHRTKIHVAITWDKPGSEPERFEITSESYKGKRISKERRGTVASGHTEFELYLAQVTKKGRCGVIKIGEMGNDFRIDFETFVKTSADTLLSEEVIQAFKSGIFEGDITNSKIRLNPDRKSFVEDNALLDFCTEIEKWHREVGAYHVEEIESASRDERYQKLGIRSMKVLEGLLLNDPSLREVIENFKRGTQGLAHTPTGKSDGKQEATSISSHSADVTRQPSKTETSGEAHDKIGAYEKHTPMSVQGPRGRKRTLVKGDSLGLQFSYEGLETSHKLWDLNTRDGVLTFNTRHPLWVQAEEAGDGCLMKLQEYVAVNALHLEQGDRDMKGLFEDYIEMTLPSIIFLIAKADNLAGRRTIVQKHMLPKKN